MAEKSILEVFGEKSKDGDELIAHTLQSIANMQRGESEDVLYKAMTKSGDPRYIHRNIQGLPTGERREWQANMLRGQIEQDPTFADTLSHKEGMERVAPQKSITSKILKALGIYRGGGKVKGGKKALKAFEAILSKGYERTAGKHEYPMGYTADQDFVREDRGTSLFRLISKIATPEGDRFYPGEGRSRMDDFAKAKASMDAASRAHFSPADSITTEQFDLLKDLDLFGRK